MLGLCCNMGRYGRTIFVADVHPVETPIHDGIHKPDRLEWKGAVNSIYRPYPFEAGQIPLSCNPNRLWAQTGPSP